MTFNMLSIRINFCPSLMIEIICLVAITEDKFALYENFCWVFLKYLLNGFGKKIFSIAALFFSFCNKKKNKCFHC